MPTRTMSELTLVARIPEYSGFSKRSLLAEASARKPLGAADVGILRITLSLPAGGEFSWPTEKKHSPVAANRATFE